MLPLRLYVSNFLCYDFAYIDFSEFSSALIIGKQEHNDNVSNGVGKTTLFKAIEYVCFNHADVNLENIIREDVDACSITFDFIAENQEYRLTRTRTNKGITDLTLYKRTALDGQETEALHIINGDKYTPLSDPKYWKDNSGRRTADTEKELGKLLKVNIKSFRIFVHFMQHDFSGLTTATPEKRKIILREALNLTIYAKLEKIAKEKCSILEKEADRFHTMIEAIGDPNKIIAELLPQIQTADQALEDGKTKLGEQQIILSNANEEANRLVSEHANLEDKFAQLLSSQQQLTSEKSKLENTIKDHSIKKSNMVKIANNLIAEIKQLEENQKKLSETDYAQIEILSEQIISNKEKVAQLNLTIQNDMVRCEKLKKPIPVDGECEECRQPITPEHRSDCQKKLDAELQDRRTNIQNCKKEIVVLNSHNTTLQQNVNSLRSAKQQLEDANNKISAKKQEIKDKQEVHNEYKALLAENTTKLEDNNKQLEQINQSLKNSPIDKAQELQKQIQAAKQNVSTINTKLATINKEIAHFTSNKAVLQHSLDQKLAEKQKKAEHIKSLKELENKLRIYPAVIQAYSNTGIPNLIIQNVLDDLQIEANNLLSQLKPGIQLSFAIEKTVGKTGEQADTLDINYTVNSKKRYYEQLSGAMQLAVNFSLKLGLSFLLQKMAGVNIKLLLLDEIDQSLDKASVDLYAEIVKMLQKNYIILVITHNDRLKDKFNNAILVEQDINMVSKARVVSSW